MNKIVYNFVLSGLLVASTPAIAGPCSGEIITSTYSRQSTYSKDYRLATYVSETAYNTIKRKAGVNAVIYGVPVGADYQDFKNTGSEMIRASNESLSEAQADNILWTGISPEVVELYKTCMTASRYGLFLYTRGATSRQIELVLDYKPTSATTVSLPLAWPGAPVGLRLPTSIRPNMTLPIIVPRPPRSREVLLAVVGRNLSAPAVKITALPALPPPYVPAWKEARVVLTSGGQVSLPGGFKIRDLSYSHVGGSNPHIHRFQANVYGPEGSLIESLTYVGDNTTAWNTRIDSVTILGHTLDYAFANWNDGQAKYHYRWK